MLECLGTVIDQRCLCVCDDNMLLFHTASLSFFFFFLAVCMNCLTVIFTFTFRSKIGPFSSSFVWRHIQKSCEGTNSVCVEGGEGGGHQFFVKLLKVERLHFNDTSVLPKINRIVFSGKIVKTFVQHSYNKQIRIVCVCVHI